MNDKKGAAMTYFNKLSSCLPEVRKTKKIFDQYSQFLAGIQTRCPPHMKHMYFHCAVSVHLIICDTGGTFGIMVTFPLCGAIMNSLGWQAAFYFTAGIMLIICLAWFFLMYNTPQEHPQITQDELQYIQNSIGYISKNGVSSENVVTFD
jgi:hypothetical protein